MLEAIRFDYARSLGLEEEKPRAVIKAAEIIEWCKDEIDDRYDWLDQHGDKAPRANRRPDMEIDVKHEDLVMLHQIRKSYEAALKARKNRG